MLQSAFLSFRKLVKDTTKQDNTDETRFDRDKRVFGDATNFFDLFIPDRLSPFFPWPASAPRSTGWPFFATRLKKPVEKSPTNERFRTFSSSGLQLNGNVLLVTHVTHLIHEMRVTHVTLMTHVMQSGARTSSQCHQQ